MLKNQKVKTWYQWIVCAIVSCIGYCVHMIKWLEFALTYISLEIGCVGVHVSWMWVVYKCQFHILIVDLALRLLKPIHMKDSLFCNLVTYWKTPSAPLNSPSWVAQIQAHNYINIPILIWILECKLAICDGSFFNLKCLGHVSWSWSSTSKTYSCPLVFWKTKSFISFVDLFV